MEDSKRIELKATLRSTDIYKLEECDQAQDRTLTKGRRGAVLLEI